MCFLYENTEIIKSYCCLFVQRKQTALNVPLKPLVKEVLSVCDESEMRVEIPVLFCSFRLFQSAAAAPSPVLGNLPPGEGMPVGPVPPGFFQVCIQCSPAQASVTPEDVISAYMYCFSNSVWFSFTSFQTCFNCMATNHSNDIFKVF